MRGPCRVETRLISYFSTSRSQLLPPTGASRIENIGDCVVAFVAREFENGFRVVLHERHGEGPWTRPRRAIVDGHRPLEAILRRRSEAFNQPQRRRAGVA